MQDNGDSFPEEDEIAIQTSVEVDVETELFLVDIAQLLSLDKRMETVESVHVKVIKNYHNPNVAANRDELTDKNTSYNSLAPLISEARKHIMDIASLENVPWREQQSQDSLSSSYDEHLESCGKSDVSISTPDITTQPPTLRQSTINARIKKKLRKKEKRMNLRKLKHEFIPPKHAMSFKHAEQNAKAWPLIMKRLNHIRNTYTSTRKPPELTTEELKRAQLPASFHLNRTAVRSLTSLYTDCTEDTEETIKAREV